MDNKHKLRGSLFKGQTVRQAVEYCAEQMKRPSRDVHFRAVECAATTGGIFETFTDYVITADGSKAKLHLTKEAWDYFTSLVSPSCEHRDVLNGHCVRCGMAYGMADHLKKIFA